MPYGSRTTAVIAYYQAALGIPPVGFEGAYVWPDVQQDLSRLGIGR